MREFSNDWSQDVWWREVVNGLSEADEDGGDAELVIYEVFCDVGVE